MTLSDLVLGRRPEGRTALSARWIVAHENGRHRLLTDGEIVIDQTLAKEHGLKVGSPLQVRGAQLRVVGLSKGTSGFMTPLAFTTRTTANELNGQPGTATFLLVRPQAGVAPATLISRINASVPGASGVSKLAFSPSTKTLI